jgi:hypothetical protein
MDIGPLFTTNFGCHFEFGIFLNFIFFIIVLASCASSVWLLLCRVVAFLLVGLQL